MFAQYTFTIDHTMEPLLNSFLTKQRPENRLYVNGKFSAFDGHILIGTKTNGRLVCHRDGQVLRTKTLNPAMFQVRDGL